MTALRAQPGGPGGPEDKPLQGVDSLLYRRGPGPLTLTRPRPRKRPMANDEDLSAEPQGQEDKDEDPGESTPAGSDLPPVLLPKVPGGGRGKTPGLTWPLVPRPSSCRTMLPSLPRRPRVPEDPSGGQLPGVRVLPLPAGEGGRGEGVLDVPGPGPHGLPQPRHHPGPEGDSDARPLPPARPGGPGCTAAAGETPRHSPARKPRLVRRTGSGVGGGLSGQAGDPDCPPCPLNLQEASSCPYWKLLKGCSSLLAPPLLVFPSPATPTSPHPLLLPPAQTSLEPLHT